MTTKPFLLLFTTLLLHSAASIDCDPSELTDPVDGTVSVSANIATYSCDVGFALLNGDIERYCNDAIGMWSGTEPTCDYAQCDDGLTLPDGAVLFSGKADGLVVEGSTANFACNAGYSLDGSASLRCDGTDWDGQVPECVQLECVAVGGIHNGEISYGGLLDDGRIVDGATVHFICNSGYSLNGVDHLECDDGAWNGNAPECIVDGSSPGVMGDPHFKLWATGEYFDYHGECDLNLMHVPSLDLQVHIRTRARYNYAYIETAAVKIGGDVLEVGSYGDYALNGVDGAFRLLDHSMLPKLSGYEVHYEAESQNKHKFDIIIAENSNITISTFKDWVNVKVVHGDQEHFGDVSGLMGDYQGQKLTREGMVATDNDLFGQDWQVRPEEEGNLFRTIRAPQYPQKCKLPSKSAQAMSRRRLGEGIARKAAEEACARWKRGTNAHNLCVSDVMASGDLEMAQNDFFLK